MPSFNCFRIPSDLAALKCVTAQTAELARSGPPNGWVGACLNFNHFDIQSRRAWSQKMTYHQDTFMRFMVTPVVCPRLFEFRTSSALCALPLRQKPIETIVPQKNKHTHGKIVVHT